MLKLLLREFRFAKMRCQFYIIFSLLEGVKPSPTNKPLSNPICHGWMD